MSRVESRALALDGKERRAVEASASLLEPLPKFVGVGDDEAGRDAGSRGANVGCEICERRVLFVAHSRHDRDPAAGHGSYEPLVAEREEILEAAAAPREHDHVDVVDLAEGGDRLDDRGRRLWALNIGLGDHDPRRREPRRDRGEDIAFGGRVVAGDQPDPAREPWKGARSLEEPFCRQLPLQALQRCEVVAKAELLDREGPEAKVASCFEELRPPVGVHPLTIGEVEPQRVELAPRHRDGEACPVARILEREEHAGPTLLPPELRDLSLDPDGREP